MSRVTHAIVGGHCLLLAAGTLAATSAEAKRRPPEPPTPRELATATAPDHAGGAGRGERRYRGAELPRFPRDTGRRSADAPAQALRGSTTCGSQRPRTCERNTTPPAVAVGREAIDAYQQLLAEYPGEADGARCSTSSRVPGTASANQSKGSRRSTGWSPATRTARTRRGSVPARRNLLQRATLRRCRARVRRGTRASDSDFTVQALYKHGWSLFKQSREDESAVSFLRCSTACSLPVAPCNARTTCHEPQRELIDDTTRALSIGFAAARRDHSAGRPQPARARTVRSAVHAALGDLYLEKERYQDAAEAYRAYAKRQPMDPEAPLLLVRATEAYQRGGFTSLVLDRKRELVAEHCPKSAFLRLNPR